MIDFIEYYKIRGHVFGECMSRGDCDLMYVYIPKNASSWTKPNLLDWGWEFYNYHADSLQHKHAMVVLRDPIDRWLSGIAEYFYLRHRNFDSVNINSALLNLIFDRVAFDDHTESQCLFIQNLDKANCTFFWCDDNYRNTFSSFLNKNGMPNKYNNYSYQHVTEHEPVRSRFKQMFRDILFNESRYLKQLQWYYNKDYKLIEETKFYAG